ncbi:MAG TPA: DUF5677 domain-containing protein [Longimicrobium sp.]|jgi:hypothetical protein
MSLEITRAIRKLGAPMLREVVDEGIRLFERAASGAREQDVHLGILFPFLHLLESIDGVEVALAAASTTSAELILRTTFEALLAVEWVTQDRNFRYAAARVVADIHKRIALTSRYQSGSDRRRQFEAEFSKDALGRHIHLPLEPDAAEKIAGLQSLLNQDHLRDAPVEFDRSRTVQKRTPEFYSLWGGPRNIEGHARKLDRGAQYELLYRQWSAVAHGDVSQRQLGTVEGAPAVRPFRSGGELSTCYVFAATYGLDAIRAILKIYRPEELNGSYPRWYSEKVRTPFGQLSQVKTGA